MRQPVAHPCDLPPFDFGETLPRLVGDSLGCLAHDQQAVDDGVVGPFVGEERRAFRASGEPQDLVAGRADVGQIEPPVTRHG